MKAEIASEKRFESVNELRKTLADQQTSFATKQDMANALSELRYKNLDEKLGVIEKVVNSTTSRSEGSQQTWGSLAAGIGLFIAFCAMVFSFITMRKSDNEEIHRLIGSRS